MITRSTLALIVALPAAALAQSPGPAFTVDDVLDVATVRPLDVSDDGRWVAAASATLRDRIGIDNARFGDPTYTAPSLGDLWAIDTRSAERRRVFDGKRQVQDAEWSPDGERLALLVLQGERFVPMVWERASGRLREVPVARGRTVAENTDLRWTDDGAEILLTVRDEAWSRDAAERFRKETRGPVVVLSSEEPFLSWDAIRRLPLERSLVAVDARTGRSRELLPGTMLRGYEAPRAGVVGYLEDVTKKTSYDVIFGSDNQLKVIPVEGGTPRVLLPSTDGRGIVWSREGRHFAYAKEGELYLGTLEGGEPRQLTKKEGERKESFTAVRLSPRGERLVASSKEGLWLIDAATGARDLFLSTPEADKEAPRYEVLDWSADGSALYLSVASRTKWERGVARFRLADRSLERVLSDARILSDFQLSADGRTWVYAVAEGNRPADLYAADADFREVRRLTDANPWMSAKKLGRTELISYLDVDGDRLHGVVYYPADYEPGRKYPTVFNLYEQYFDDRFSATIAYLNANGYVVVQPSVELETGFPGEAWVKGVTAAANRVIEMGVADPERLGVQGTSYGGYATNLLITQTDRFRAAINISGKVNMVSFYTDSPRLGVRNIHAPEKSQDRLGATLWEQPQKYLAHSAILAADRIDTPLLLMTGEQDHNVPARQAMEMYYALRRLGKRVEWVNYVNGGHGMPTSTVEEVRDYHQRILAWYDRYLKAEKPKTTQQ